MVDPSARTKEDEMNTTEYITSEAEFAELRRQYEKGYMTEAEYDREMSWRIAPLVRKDRDAH